MRTSVLIVGGGLAGLTLAHRLHTAGVDFQLVEARDRFGGRILSAGADGLPSDDGFDLGPSWFWPDSQPGLGRLIDVLGLSAFPQHSDGDVVFHRMSREAPQRYRGFQQSTRSMRLAGGTGAVITALVSALPTERLHLSSPVSAMALVDDRIEATVSTSRGPETWTADRIAFALPPRIVEAGVSISPPPEDRTRDLWRATPTWMAPHAKFFALYERPFWRESGLSGSAQSMVGPLVEIHDATSASGVAALFGFVGPSGAQRQAMGEAALTRVCIEQLTLLFGADASQPTATLLKDWSIDPFTSSPTDADAAGHPAGGNPVWFTGDWRGRAWMAGSETSASEPGYLAGAVDAAERVADEILESLSNGGSTDDVS